MKRHSHIMDSSIYSKDIVRFKSDSSRFVSSYSSDITYTNDSSPCSEIV